MRVSRRFLAAAAAIVIFFSLGAAAQRTSSRHFEGKLPDGAAWAIDVPQPWNGALLIWSHGYSPVVPASVDVAPRGLKPWLLEHGFALAASSYAKGGWSLAEAVPDQLGVVRQFKAKVGAPRHVIAWGESMGGLVTVALAEEDPAMFDGALSACGSVAGSVAMLNEGLDGAFAFKTLVAPDSGIALVHPADDLANLALVRAAVEQAQKTPEGRARIALAATLGQLPAWSDSRDPEPSRTDWPAQEVQAAKTLPMGLFMPRVDQERRAGGVYSWNAGVNYGAQLAKSGRSEFVRALYGKAHLDLNRDLARLAATPRIVAQPAAVAYMMRNYVPSGKLRIPMLTLHTIGDGFTTVSVEQAYAEAVARQGDSAYLREAFVHRAGHCNFSQAELTSALHALIRRVEVGKWSVSPRILNADTWQNGGTTAFVKFRPAPFLRPCARGGVCAGAPLP